MRRTVSVLVGMFGVLVLACGTSAQAQEAFDGTVLKVSENHWAFPAVVELAQKGIVEGYPDGFFRGSQPLTRYEFVVAMRRFIDKIVPATAPRRQSLVEELNHEIALALVEADQHAEAPDTPLPKKEKAAPLPQKRTKKR